MNQYIMEVTMVVVITEVESYTISLVEATTEEDIIDDLCSPIYLEIKAENKINLRKYICKPITSITIKNHPTFVLTIKFLLEF